MRNFLIAVSVIASMVSVCGANAAELGQMKVLSKQGEPLEAELEVRDLLSSRTTPRLSIADAKIYAQAKKEYPPELSGLKMTLKSKEPCVISIKGGKPITKESFPLIMVLKEGEALKAKLYAMQIPKSVTAAAAGDSLAEMTQNVPAVVEHKEKVAPESKRPAPQAVASPKTASDSLPAHVYQSKVQNQTTPVARQSVSTEQKSASAPTASAAELYQVSAGKTLWSVAKDLKPRYVTSTMDQVMVAIVRKNPAAFDGARITGIKAGATLSIPTEMDVANVDGIEALALSRYNGNRSVLGKPTDEAMQKAVAEIAKKNPRFAKELEQKRLMEKKVQEEARRKAAEASAIARTVSEVAKPPKQKATVSGTDKNTTKSGEGKSETASEANGTKLNEDSVKLKENNAKIDKNKNIKASSEVVDKPVKKPQTRSVEAVSTPANPPVAKMQSDEKKTAPEAGVTPLADNSPQSQSVTKPNAGMKDAKNSAALDKTEARQKPAEGSGIGKLFAQIAGALAIVLALATGCFYAWRRYRASNRVAIREEPVRFIKPEPTTDGQIEEIEKTVDRRIESEKATARGFALKEAFEETTQQTEPFELQTEMMTTPTASKLPTTDSQGRQVIEPTLASKPEVTASAPGVTVQPAPAARPVAEAKPEPFERMEPRFSTSPASGALFAQELQKVNSSASPEEYVHPVTVSQMNETAKEKSASDAEGSSLPVHSMQENLVAAKRYAMLGIKDRAYVLCDEVILKGNAQEQREAIEILKMLRS